MAKRKVNLSGLRVSDFKFHLPEALIASRPAKERDESRLMILHKSDGSIEHKPLRILLTITARMTVLYLTTQRLFQHGSMVQKRKTTL